MSVSIQRIEGVESVNVSLNQGMVHIRLKPGNTVRIEQVLRAVTNNGFTPKEIEVEAIGTAVSLEGQLKFRLAETDQTFDVTVDPASKNVSDDVRNGIGKAVSMDGLIAVSKGKTPQVLAVTGIKEVQ